MTRIVCISDTHNKHNQVQVPDGDILIHAGDFTMQGKVWKVESFLYWIDNQPHKHKCIIAGNHDWLAQKDPGLFQKLINETQTVDYLQDSFVKREGFKIWGSPWTKRFYDWAFNMDDSELGNKWNLIPEDCDIVITHGPMYGIADKAPRGKGFEHTGCQTLYQTLVKRVRPKLHICGHIHEGFSINKLPNEGIVSVNASSLDEKYRCTNPPIIVDFNGKEIKSIQKATSFI